MRLKGTSPETLASFGEMLVAGDEGIVSAEARLAFENALKQDASHIKSAFYLALAAEQEGDSATARSRYESLAARLTPEMPLRAMIEERLKKLPTGRGTP